MLLGLLRPVIVLPEGVGEDALESVLRHELSHLRRRDILCRWFSMLALSLHWFNPITLLVRRELDAQCELGCDEDVMSGMPAAERLRYGEVLLNMAGRRLPTGAPAASMGGGRERMSRRIAAIAGYKKPPRGRLALCFALAVLTLSCSLLVGAAAVDETGEASAPQPTEPAAVQAAPAPSAEPPEGASVSGWVWPCPASTEVSAVYGVRTHPVFGVESFHSGIDIPAVTGSSVEAACDGTVEYAGYSQSYGNYIVIAHGEDIVTLYAHLERAEVAAGDAVTAGQAIGAVGQTGWATGPHLHVEVRFGGELIDPLTLYEESLT